MRNSGRALTCVCALVVASVMVVSAPVAAFCGFYVDTGGAAMFNNATHVVLMREGTRTVLSMQNNYEGPLKDFALVIPVPTVLKAGDVRTLPKSVFAKVNATSAPRLVEYWESDPCNVYNPEADLISVRQFATHSEPRFGVTIEAQFDVDEYKIVILSAKESTGLEQYLRAQRYKIPDGAAPLLRPYVESGSKFFVARVDPAKVKVVNGQATLSPLRFHYDSDELSLPIRLGLANSAGTQDLIVNILSPAQRYDVANYPNATIPTNIEVTADVRTRFGEFYAALLDRTMQLNPGAVITEYAWAASSCDPCPGPPLTRSDLMLLGEDALVSPTKPPPPPKPASPPPPPKPAPPPPPPSGAGSGSDPDEIEIEPDPAPEFEPEDEEPYRDFVLTRLHARYGTDGAPRDLVFRKAPPIEGGLERRSKRDAPLSTTALPSEGSRNAFQGRFIIRHPWTDPISCDEPVRGNWGGKDGRYPSRYDTSGAAMDTVFVPRGQLQLQSVVKHDIPAIAVTRGVPLSPPLPGPPVRRVKARGCGGCAATSDASVAFTFAFAFAFVLVGFGASSARRRRARCR